MDWDDVINGIKCALCGSFVVFVTACIVAPLFLLFLGFFVWIGKIIFSMYGLG